MMDAAERSTPSGTIEKPTSVLRVAKGGAFLAAGSLYSLAVRLLIALILARQLGAGAYGEYILAISVTTIVVGIAALGLPPAMVRFIAIQRSRNDDARVWGTIQVGVGAGVVAGLVMGALLFFAAAPIAETIFDEPGIEDLLKILAIVTPFMTASSVFSGVVRGFKRMDYSAFSEQVVKSTVRFLLVAVMAAIGLDVVVAAIIYGISELATTFSLVVLANREFSLRRPLSEGRREVREIAVFSFPLWLSRILRRFRKNIQLVLLGALSTASNVGFFAIASRVNLVGHVTYTAVIRSVAPDFADLHAKGDRTAMRNLYRTTTRWMFIANIPFFLIIALYAEPVLAVFGTDFESAATALTLLALGELVMAGTGTSGTVIDMAGYTKLKLVNSIIWIVLLISLNFLLIPRWGVTGAATAALVSGGAVNVLRLLEVWWIERIQPYDRTFFKPIVAGVGTLLIALLLGVVVPPATNLLTTVFSILFVWVVFAGLNLALGLAPEDRLVLGAIRRRIGARLGRSEEKVAP